MKVKPFFAQRKNQLGLIVIAIVLVAIFAFNSFPTQSLQVAYLYPFREGTPNIWLASLDNPDDAQQLTHTKMGILGFDVSQNGRMIAYTMRDENTRMRDIYLLDIESGDTRQLTFCAEENLECYSPAFHPDNTVLAYVQLSIVDDEHGEHGNVENIWLLDIETGESRPLANDFHLVGHSPLWSRDGKTLAFYNADIASPRIIVYNFKPSDGSPRTQYAATSYNGLVGSLAPDSLKLIYPDFINGEGQTFSYLNLADFEQEPPVFESFTEPDGTTDDIAAEWNPDGEHVTIARRYTDSRWTQGFQLYEMDIESKEISPLLYDENYSHHYFDWDNWGEQLLVQRVPVSDSINIASRPEIWVLDTTTGELTLIAEAAYHPRWVLEE